MEAKNFTLKIKHRFTSNTGSFKKQPIINLLNNNSLTGGGYISIYKIVDSREESSSLTAIPDHAKDGVYGLTFSDGESLTSLTGTKRIRSNSISSMSELSSALATTAASYEYTTTLVVNEENDLDLLVEENGVLYDIFNLDELSFKNPFYYYVGYGVRPEPEGIFDVDGNQTVVADGTTSNTSLILQYQYNAMENCGDTFATSGLTGIYDWSGNSNSASVFGQGLGDMANFDIDNSVSSTVTGHYFGPIEGAFKMEGSTFLKTTNPSAASLFNTRSESTSGFTIMAYVKFNVTADTDIITIADGTDTLGKISLERGCITFSNSTDSISAGYIETEGNPALTAGVELSRWMHVAATMNSKDNDSASGTKLYINGIPQVLAGSETTLSADMFSIPELNDISTVAHIGINPDETTNPLVGAISLTRVFNRPLSDSEIFMNFISTIPSQSVVDEINIS